MPPTPDAIEAIFLRESVRLTGALTRLLGPRNLELAEDVVQEAFARALEVWPDQGLPDKPGAWLMRTARNRAIDAIRRERSRRHFDDDVARLFDSDWSLGPTVEQALADERLEDDELTMIFMCCAIEGPAEDRIALMLRTLCGMRVRAIARALLTTEAAMHKRLLRTRKRLRGVPFRMPKESERPEALRAVHAALYLLFNEGYLSSSGAPIQIELCRSAMFLARLLLDHPDHATSATHALLALMCFHAARFEGRTDAEGALVPLDLQDRSGWDPRLLAIAERSLRRAQAGGRVTRYHLEAEIAAHHCRAQSFEATDWRAICALHDRLAELHRSPVAALNRAIAYAYRDGPAAGIAMVHALEPGTPARRAQTSAVLALLHARAGHRDEAERFRQVALEAAPTAHERALLEQQLVRAMPREA